MVPAVGMSLQCRDTELLEPRPQPAQGSFGGLVEQQTDGQSHADDTRLWEARSPFRRPPLGYSLD